MKRILIIIAAVFVAGAASAWAQGTAFTYQGLLMSEGAAANGTYDLRFTLYDQATNGIPQAGPIETNGVPVTNGVFTVRLDFGASVFSGAARWLEVSVKNSLTDDLPLVLSPRQPVTPTPYAINAANLMNLDNAPLDIKVNGQRALRLEPTARGEPNVIGGSASNYVATGYAGATIAGGHANVIVGDYATVGGGRFNSSSGFGSTIAGGNRNQASSEAATVGGGDGNWAGHEASTIAGGAGNTTSGDYAAIGGGSGNMASDGFATVGGGLSNHSSGPATAIGGGSGNIARGEGSTVGGGNLNVAAGDFSVVGGGDANQAPGGDSTIAGGAGNRATASGSFVGGGEGNWSAGVASGVASGSYNSAFAELGFIGGGYGNQVASTAYSSIIAGGTHNTCQGQAAFIGGGNGNLANGNVSVIAGGVNNSNSALASVIGGGSANSASGTWAVIAGGFSNQATQEMAAVSGGAHNVASGAASAIAGGRSHTASGGHSMIAGGFFNTAAGETSFAAGYNARALHHGSFVWADATFRGQVTYAFDSVAENEFAVRATGGTRIVSAVSPVGVPVAGVELAPGSGAWSMLSDRNAKENFSAVNPRSILEKVASLSLATWNYKSQDKAIRHIGPTAQDFHAAFGVGENERTIATVDTDGVALAAIQGLNQKFEEQLKAKDAHIETLQHRVERLEKLITALIAQPGK